MGLPIWNYPDEKKTEKQTKDAVKHDPTAASRSTIRRPTSFHARRSNARTATINDSATIRLRRARDNYWDSDVPLPAPELDSSSRDLRSTVQSRDGTLTAGRAPSRLRHRLSEAHRSTENEPATRQARRSLPSAGALPNHASRRAAGDSAATRPARRGFTARRQGEFIGEAPSQPERDSLTRSGRRAQLARRSSDRQRIGGSELAAVARRSLRRREASDAFVPAPLVRARPLSPTDAMLPTPSGLSEHNHDSPRMNLPTPPLDTSMLPDPSEILERGMDSPHPLSFASRAFSPDNGLGDRRRSVSPSADVWQIMRSTITPDETLPSTSSSFTSAAAATASFSVPADDDDANSTAPTHLGQGRPGVRDVSFEETMREMGIEISSSSDNSSDKSDSDSDDSLTSDDDSDDQSMSEDGEYGTTQAERLQRRMIARQLYNMAMSTAEGREQIEMLRNSARPPTDMLQPLAAQPGDQNQDGSSALPVPEPQHFSAAVHERAQEAALLTHAFFGQEDADQSNPESAEASVLPYDADEARRRVLLSLVQVDNARGRFRATADEAYRAAADDAFRNLAHGTAAASRQRRSRRSRRSRNRDVSEGRTPEETLWMLTRPFSQREGDALVHHF